MAAMKTAGSFKAAVAADHYTSKDVVDFAAAQATLEKFAPEIAAISAFAGAWEPSSTDLARLLLSAPKVYELICSLLSITSDIEFEDGRRLPSPLAAPKLPSDADEAAKILMELGVLQVLKPGTDVAHLLLILQITGDAARRRLRVEARVTAKVLEIVDAAIVAANAESKQTFSRVGVEAVPSGVRRLAEHVISVDGVPRVVIASTFQTYSGGRQTRDFRSVYPSMQTALSPSGMSLVLIADGQGMRRIPDATISAVLNSIPHLFTLSQAAAGGLTGALLELAETPAPSMDSAGLQQLIETALSVNTEVAASSLPTTEGQAALALATFVSAHKQLALELRPDGASLAWQRSMAVRGLRSGRLQWNARNAVAVWRQLIRAALQTDLSPTDRYGAQVVVIPEDDGFAGQFLIGATNDPPTPLAVRQFSVHALQNAPASRMAVLLTTTRPTEQIFNEIRRLQPTLPVTVVMVDVGTALRIAKDSASPLARFRSIVLAQSDLTKMSPFVVRSVTPDRVFFGREEEEATLIGTVMSNSVALLGGRRIGKTSLLQHSVERLKQAELRPFFLDCQVVRNWVDFGTLASRAWGVKLPEVFKPQHLLDLVSRLDDGSGKAIVIMLDEIDQMLDWDSNHETDEVPEAFFRACRAISQEGRAQFVFSGERTIAQKLWDPSSPHWNFCKPILLQQLSANAGRALIAQPLEGMGVRIEDRPAFVQAAWTCTDGHPELLQFLGDHLVAIINGRDRKDVHVTPLDVGEASHRLEYAEQYLETYWGQATPLERLISIVVAEGQCSVAAVIQEIEGLGVKRSYGDVMRALHMLNLYGIISQANDGYDLRAKWFPSALTYYGGVQDARARYLSEVTS